jgi:hypothetical protein
MSHPASLHGQDRPVRRLGAVALAALLALGMGLWPGPAAAKSQKKVSYSYEQVWPAAVRFLRVDEGFEITEKDVEAGYVIFVVAEDGKRFRGSMEIVRISGKDEPPALLLLIGIEDRPEYMEQGILDRFEQKLRAELGAPRPVRPAPAAPVKPKEDGKADRSP